MAINFTDEQKNAIYGKGTILVYAAAGSGKTAVLSKRVIERVCDPKDPATIDRLLIVTFTNASALEMRVRIGKELDLKAKENPNNTYILKQKLLLKNAKICTIDSFCIDLVRKHFGILGISPDFSVATSADTSYLSEKALKTVLAKHFANPSKEFKSLCESFNIYSSDNGLHNAIKDIYDFCLCMSRPKAWLENAVENYTNTDLKTNSFADIIFKNALMKISSVIEQFNMIMLETVDLSVGAKITESFSSAIDYLTTMKSCVENKDWDSLYNMSNSYSTPSLPIAKKWDSQEDLEKIKRVRDNCKDRIKSIAEDMVGPGTVAVESLKQSAAQVGMLVQLVNEYSEEYYNLLLSKNIFTFSHIEQLALKLLCDDDGERLVPSELSREVCKLYDEVLVDEYQDNNDLQDSLFNAVSDSGKHLFLVGDVKQSIYGFRNASPDNFLKHKNSFPLFDGENDPSKVILSANFRSRSGVCDFVNGICKTLMQKATSGMDYDMEEELVPKATYPDNGKTAVDVYLNNSENNKRDETDAEIIASYIEKTMQEEPFLKDGDTLRKADFEDFAILMRSPGSKVRYYTDALKRHGIPVSYNVGEFFKSHEILTAISILKVINNPTDDISLLSAMTSVAFGFDFDSIANLKIKYKSKSLYANVIKSAEDNDEKCQEFLNTINKLRTRSVTLPVSRFITEMYNITFLREIMSAGANGNDCLANLLTLVSIAADYENISQGGLQGFLAHFDRLAQDGSVGDKASNTNSNAVKIISFHSSKGLQFPICIIAGVGNNFNKTDLNDKIILSNEFGLGLNIVSDGLKLNTISRKALRIVQNEKLIAEELRLRYVAMTRAEERLMISVTSPKCREDIVLAAASLGLSAVNTGLVPTDAVINAQGFKSMLLSALLLQKDGDKLGEIADINPIGHDGNADFNLYFTEHHSFEETIFESSEESNHNYSCDIETEKMLNERFGFEYPNIADTKIPSKMAVTSLVHGEKATFAFKSRPRFMSKSGLTPAERGTAMHKVMQYVDFSAAEIDLPSELERLYEYEFLSLEEYESLDRKALENFFKSNLFERLKCSEKVLREYKFMVNYPYVGSETIIQGIADCIFFENGKAIIVDFKTDNVSSANELKERYAEQLEIYKSAISEIFSVTVSECIIYSTHLSSEISI